MNNILAINFDTKKSTHHDITKIRRIVLPVVDIVGVVDVVGVVDDVGVLIDVEVAIVAEIIIEI